MNPVIKHQTQPCANSCVSTCLAMLAGIPASDVSDKFNDQYHAQEISTNQMMRDLGIKFEAFTTGELNRVDRSGAWLVHVPSLNIEGVIHQILLEYHESGDWFVHDPNKGKDGKRFYVPHGLSSSHPMAVDISSFEVDAFITMSWLLKRVSA